jgi:hypothetical protein
MPQARASSIIMFENQCHGARNAATRLQGLQREGCTGKRHLNWTSWQHGEATSWHNRAISLLLFQTSSAST